MYTAVGVAENAHNDGVWAVCWGRGGKLITGSVDNTVKTWNVDTTIEPNHTYLGHELGVISVSADLGGKYFASSSLDSRIKLWDGEEKRLVRTIEGGPVEVWTVAYDPHAPRVASGTHEGTIHVYDTETGDKTLTLNTKDKFVMSVAYSKKGHHLASGAENGNIYVFDSLNGRLMSTLHGHAMAVRSLCFSPDGRFLVSASDDKRVHMYDVHHGSLVAAFAGHASWVLSVAWSPATASSGSSSVGPGAPDHLASGSCDKRVKVWDIRARQCLHTLDHHEDQVWGVAYNETGTRLATVSDDKSVRVYSCQ